MQSLSPGASLGSNPILIQRGEPWGATIAPLKTDRPNLLGPLRIDLHPGSARGLLRFGNLHEG